MPRSSYAVAPRAVAGLLAAVVLALALLWVTVWGPGALPERYPPTGVDGLTVPTPSPDPGDFVDTVDNPWLPYAPGASWTYALDDGARLTVTVGDEPEQVAGVDVTTVTQEVIGGDVGAPGPVLLLVAQDTAGNVWSFGADTPEVSWRAGVDGAQAGLLVPAEPRLGDGFQPGVADGLDAVLSVAAVDLFVTVPAGSWDDAIMVETMSPSGSTSAATWLVRGVGPVLVTDRGEPPVRQELLDHEPGAATG